MTRSPGNDLPAGPLDWPEFESMSSRALQDLAAATGTPPDALKRSAAQSLVVLRLAGELVLPALRTAATSPGQRSLNDLIDGPISDLVSVASHGSLSTTTLWGDVASVIESSARIVAAEHPASAGRAMDVATQALTREPLRECWTGKVGATFRRTSCCLVVGPDPGELRCGDCVRNASAN